MGRGLADRAPNPVPRDGRSSPTVTLVVDLDDYALLHVDEQACSIWDCDVPAELIGQKLSSLLGTSDIAIAERLNPYSINKGQSYYTIIPTARGRRVRALVSYEGMVKGSSNHAILTITVVNPEDMAARERDQVFRQIQAQLEQERDYIDLVFQAAPVGLMLINSETYVEKANRQLFVMFEREMCDVFGRRFGNIFDCAIPAREGILCGTADACNTCSLRNGVLSVLSSGEAIQGAEVQHDFMVNGQETEKWLKVSASPLQIGSKRYALVAMDDITTRVEIEQRLKRLSYTDELSGLHNRRAILDALDEQLAILKGKGGVSSLAMLDIDDFKRLNDKHGHVAGDTVIGKFGRALSDCLRATDLAGRYGGEEFLVLLPGADPSAALIVLDRVRARLAELTIDLPHGTISVSGGIVGVTPEQARSHESYALVDMADELMYRAKAMGKNRILIDRA